MLHLYHMVHLCCFGFILFFFENGKAAKVPLKSYETKTKRKKLANAYSGKSKLCGIIYIREDSDILLKSTAGKVLIFNTALISPKATRDTIGVQVITLRGKNLLEGAEIADERIMNGLKKYIVKNVPAAGMGGKDLIEFNQLSLNEE